MTITHYTHISWNSRNITVFSTDAKLLDDVTMEVKKFVPGCDYSIDETDINNNKAKIYFSKLENKNTKIGIWLLRWIGSLGWVVIKGELLTYDGAYDLVKQE